MALVLTAAPGAADAAEPAEFVVGADVSFLAHAESSGMVFKEEGQPKPGLQILKDHGYTWVRLRLFHTPDRLPNNLDYTLAAAQAAKRLGFRLLLNLHYSDTWADPQKQFVPRAWKGLPQDQLVEEVFAYTRDTMGQFKSAGVMPDMVQVGNEVISGLLWPGGRLPENWSNFADLVQAGVRGVSVGAAPDAPPPVMLHIDRGGDLKSTRWFFDNCRARGIEFDVIGQSYYPWWHGSLDDLRKNLDFMAREYGKDVYLVEVAYNWRPAEYRDQPGPFPETPDGQREFLKQAAQILRATADGRGKGIFWWEPAVMPGAIASRGMFDDQGNALPVISVFDAPAAGALPAHPPAAAPSSAATP